MAVPDKQLARMPGSVSFEEAGSMPLVALTAFQVQFQTLPRTLTASQMCTGLCCFSLCRQVLHGCTRT